LGSALIWTLANFDKKKLFFEVTPKDEIYRTKAKYSLAFLYAATTTSFDIYDIFILCTHRKKVEIRNV